MTTDDIIAMRKACDMQGLSQEFEALVAERDAAQRDNAKLRTVMIAAAEEISAHWDAHCDAEGYGPANLMHRLEQGIPSEYGYTSGAFAELKAERDALKAESLLWSHRAGEDAAQHRKTVEERDALEHARNNLLCEKQQVEDQRDALRQDVQRLSEALRQEIDPPTFMGEPVSLLCKPVKSIADIKECYCPQDKCQAPVIMGRQTPCIRKMKEQK